MAKYIEIFLNAIIKHSHFDFSCKISIRISLFFIFNSIISLPNKSEVSSSLCFHSLLFTLETLSSFRFIHSKNTQSSLFQLCNHKTDAQDWIWWRNDQWKLGHHNNTSSSNLNWTSETWSCKEKKKKRKLGSTVP